MCSNKTKHCIVHPTATVHWNVNRFSVFRSVQPATFQGTATRPLDSQPGRCSGPLEEQQPSLIQSAAIATLGSFTEEVILFPTNPSLWSDGRPTSHPILMTAFHRQNVQQQDKRCLVHPIAMVHWTAYRLSAFWTVEPHIPEGTTKRTPDSRPAHHSGPMEEQQAICIPYRHLASVYWNHNTTFSFGYLSSLWSGGATTSQSCSYIPDRFPPEAHRQVLWGPGRPFA